MVSKNNFKNKMEQTAARTPHYGIRKLSVGVASVLISTTLYMGATTAKADTLPSTATDTATTKPETASTIDKRIVFITNDGKMVGNQTVSGKQGTTGEVKLNVPNGYELSDGTSPTIKITFDNQDQNVKVVVVPAAPEMVEREIQFVDENGNPIATQKTTGEVNKKQNVKLNIPDGYELPKGQSDMIEVTYDQSLPVRVMVVKKSQIINKQIRFIGDNGKVVGTQQVSGQAGSTVDISLKIPDGYQQLDAHNSISLKLTDETPFDVRVTKVNPGEVKITYVDDDKGETTVDSYILAGKTDETVKTGIKIPDGYEVEGQVPTDYTFKAKDNTDITVRLKHKLDKGTETKTVSRIVEITLPDGQTKTIKQEQTLKRSKTTDLVTGDVVYGEWSKAEFDEVVAPEVDGYKPSQAKVEKETVDGNSSDQVVKITYKKIKSDVKVEAKPTVEAKHEAKVQVAPKVEAKASAKPQAKAQPKFVTTELPQTGEKQSKGTTIGAILVGLGSLLGLGALGKRKEK